MITTKQTLVQRQLYEVANTSTYDANGTVLGTWNPHHMIKGPKRSLFVACNTAVKSSYGANSVYCYHIVVSQNVATGDFYTSNVYPVYANSNWQNNGWQYCSGLALDHNDPPNLYYATGNTIFKIEPKGYSYHMGDTKITQLLGEDYLRTTFNYNPAYPVMGKFQLIRGTPDLHLYREPTSYIPMKVDRRDRLYFAARSNLYCYDTRLGTLETVYTPWQYVANINYSSLLSSNVETMTINSFDVDLDTNQVYFSIRTVTNNLTLSARISPNSNGSFNVAQGGQNVALLMTPDVTTQAQFSTDGTQGVNLYRSLTGAKVILRPSKNEYK